MITDENARLGLLMSDGSYRYFGTDDAVPRLEVTWFYSEGQWEFDNLMVLPLYWTDEDGQKELALDIVNFFGHGNIMGFDVSYSVSYDDVGGTWTLDIFGQTIEGIVEGDSSCIIDVSSVYFVR